MSTSPTLFNTSGSSAATRLASPPHKLIDTKPKKLRNNAKRKSTLTTNNDNHNNNNNCKKVKHS